MVLVVEGTYIYIYIIMAKLNIQVDGLFKVAPWYLSASTTQRRAPDASFESRRRSLVQKPRLTVRASLITSTSGSIFLR